MYLTIHTPFSLIIGKLISNPLLAFILAFVFHFVLDAIPHDPLTSLNIFVISAYIDLFLLSILIYILVRKKKLKLNTTYFCAILGGMFPDIILALNILTLNKIKILQIITHFHSSIVHKLIYPNIFISLNWAILIQGITFVLGLLLFLKLSKKDSKII